MREEIYSWMKDLAVYYIFLTAVMNFIPDEKYARYIRYFTGILLILLLCSPILQLFRLDGSLMENFNRQLQMTWQELPDTEGESQKRYLVPAYEKEMEEQVVSYLAEQGIAVAEADVSMDEESLEVLEITIRLEGRQDENREEEIAGGLEERYQLGRENISFFYSEHGEAAMVHPAAGGDPAGGDRSADREEDNGENGVSWKP
ncbi:MAG: stage III sporulation protein AF [Blautia sp.]|jgi:stage III sporulation protein AF